MERLRTNQKREGDQQQVSPLSKAKMSKKMTILVPLMRTGMSTEVLQKMGSLKMKRKISKH